MTETGKVQITGVMLATAFCCAMPVMIYWGDVFCKLHKIEPPDADAVMRCSLLGVGSVMAWGYPGFKEMISGLLNRILGKKNESKTN